MHFFSLWNLGGVDIPSMIYGLIFDLWNSRRFRLFCLSPAEPKRALVYVTLRRDFHGEKKSKSGGLGFLTATAPDVFGQKRLMPFKVTLGGRSQRCARCLLESFWTSFVVVKKKEKQNLIEWGAHSMGSSAGWLGEKERGREKARDMSFWTERVASRRESSVASYTGRLGLYMAVVYIYIFHCPHVSPGGPLAKHHWLPSTGHWPLFLLLSFSHPT